MNSLTTYFYPFWEVSVPSVVFSSYCVMLFLVTLLHCNVAIFEQLNFLTQLSSTDTRNLVISIFVLLVPGIYSSLISTNQLTCYYKSTKDINLHHKG